MNRTGPNTPPQRAPTAGASGTQNATEPPLTTEDRSKVIKQLLVNSAELWKHRKNFGTILTSVAEQERNSTRRGREELLATVKSGVPVTYADLLAQDVRRITKTLFPDFDIDPAAAKVVAQLFQDYIETVGKSAAENQAARGGNALNIDEMYSAIARFEGLQEDFMSRFSTMEGSISTAVAANPLVGLELRSSNLGRATERGCDVPLGIASAYHEEIALMRFLQNEMWP